MPLRNAAAKPALRQTTNHPARLNLADSADSGKLGRIPDQPG